MMIDLGFEIKETIREEGNHQVEIFQVPGPNLLTEKLIPLNFEAVDQMAKRLGTKPSRSSLCRWRDTGYPIDRYGPRILLPYCVRLKRAYTSSEALIRWFRVIQAVGEEIRLDGGVKRWRKRRQKEAAKHDRDQVDRPFGHNPPLHLSTNGSR